MRPMRRNAFLLLLVGLVDLAACGGKIAPSDAGSSSSSSSSSGGTTSGGAEDGCTVTAQPGNRACVPPDAQSNAAISIDIDTTEGCIPCFATMEPCTVAVRGTQITVGMQTRSCGNTDNRACPAICAIPGVTCQLPPLAAGTYTVLVTGEGQNALSRELVVTDTSTTTSCKLVRPVPSIGPFVLSRYDRSCTQASDCTAIPSLLCRACACEDAAIATSSVATFEADFRAASSQCKPQPTGTCAPCARPAIACVAGQCQIGT